MVDLLDHYLPVYDVVLTEHLVVHAPPDVVFQTAKEYDFLTTRSLVVTGLMSVRTLPSRQRGRTVTRGVRHLRRTRLGEDRLPSPRPRGRSGQVRAHLRVPHRYDGPGRACPDGTLLVADPTVRPYILRAVLSTIRVDAESAAELTRIEP